MLCGSIWHFCEYKYNWRNIFSNFFFLFFLNFTFFFWDFFFVDLSSLFMGLLFWYPFLGMSFLYFLIEAFFFLGTSVFNRFFFTQAFCVLNFNAMVYNFEALSTLFNMWNSDVQHRCSFRNQCKRDKKICIKARRKASQPR